MGAVRAAWVVGVGMALAAAGAGPEAGMSHKVTAPGAEVQCLSSEFKFTEGPACDADGNVYFTDQPNDRIMIWSTDGKLSTFMQPSGRANGLCFTADGKLLACADEHNELWLIDPKDKSHQVVVSEYKGQPLNSTNDVWVRHDGGIYITDPFYGRDYWPKDRKHPQDIEAVYYVAPGSHEAVRVIDDMKQPNGIIGTPDGKTLYVADIGRGETYRYSIRPDGSLGDKTLFCKMGSDGMTIDDEGNVYLTGRRGVTVFDKSGKRIELIPIDEAWTANVCFGGADRRTLFVTASKSLYSVRMRTKGAGSQ